MAVLILAYGEPVGGCGKDYSHHSTQEAKNRKERTWDLGPGLTFKGTSGLLLSARQHFLKFPDSLKIAPPAKEQAANTED